MNFRVGTREFALGVVVVRTATSSAEEHCSKRGVEGRGSLLSRNF